MPMHGYHASVFFVDHCVHGRLRLFADRLGHHQPCGLRRPCVSEHERVGGDLGERRLPRVQLLTEVSHVHLITFST